MGEPDVPKSNQSSTWPSFSRTLQLQNLELSRTPAQILQVNLGKLCNMACLHCHVEAGPKRTEQMGHKTARRIIELMQACPSLTTLDLTGGAPEMNEHFREFVSVASQCGLEILDRCNLTILFEEGYDDLPEFLAQHSVTIVASLPCYTAENVDKQRGSHAFQKSIAGLKRLNALGYGTPNSSLKLHLVYNPLGANLPPDQATLEAEYSIRLKEDFGIVFNDLYTITNMPIKRFLHQLRQWGKDIEYMELLVNSFNPGAISGLMCRNTISISWEGELFDCDFNQMLEIPIGHTKTSIWDITQLDELFSLPIATADHCYGCTAGSGSSCSGALI